MSARAKRESAALERYMDEVLLEMSSQKIKTKNKNYHDSLRAPLIEEIGQSGAVCLFGKLCHSAAL